MVLLLSIYLLLLHCIFRIECATAIADPDETFDKTHGLYRF